MCLILFAYRQHAEYPLIVIANRDEYYARATRDAHWWEGTEIFAGRDLEAGGTWLGVNRRGNFAAVTNVREPGGTRAKKKSRGELTRGYLAGDIGAEAYLRRLTQVDQDYAGFNLLLGDHQNLWFYSNRKSRIHRVKPGVYGISNGGFDEPWPKLRSGTSELKSLLSKHFDTADLFDVLTDRSLPPDHQLPATGVALDIERMLSSRFISSPKYGTRACTVLTISADQAVCFNENNFIDAEHSGTKIRESFVVRSKEALQKAELP